MIICISLFFKKYNVSATINYVTIQNIAQYKIMITLPFHIILTLSFLVCICQLKDRHGF